MAGEEIWHLLQACCSGLQCVDCHGTLLVALVPILEEGERAFLTSVDCEWQREEFGTRLCELQVAGSTEVCTYVWKG